MVTIFGSVQRTIYRPGLLDFLKLIAAQLKTLCAGVKVLKEQEYAPKYPEALWKVP